MADAPRSKFMTKLGRLLPSRLARRFVRQQDGAAAVEFALVAAPFLALTFAILETAFVFFAQQTLDTFEPLERLVDLPLFAGQFRLGGAVGLRKPMVP